MVQGWDEEHDEGTSDIKVRPCPCTEWNIEGGFGPPVVIRDQRERVWSRERQGLLKEEMLQGGGRVEGVGGDEGDSDIVSGYYRVRRSVVS